MKQVLIFLILGISYFSFSQEDKEKQALITKRNANNYIAEANTLNSKDDFVLAEVEYRKALSEQPTSVAGTYNLAHSYFNKGNFEEALYRNQQAAKNATEKSEKHKAFHNMGNILMENKKCKEAAEAFKNALRNNPQDEETRYNFALAKECAKKQEEENKNNKDQDDKSEEEEKKDENKDQQDKDDKNKEDQKEDQDKEDKGDDDKKEGDDEKDEEGKPKDDKKENGDQGENEKKQPQQPKPQPGQLSPQQIRNLLEDTENQEQKVQEKVNAQKAKGVKVETDKDW